MKEDFLHYVWLYKKFNFSPLNSSELKTAQGESLQIHHTGNYLQQSGPDFFNAQVSIENQKWAGNIEIHSKSSDWYVHHHEFDSGYDNVILHVVWEKDSAVFRKDNSEIPVLELKNYVSQDLICQYQKLKTSKSWIFCENEMKSIPRFVIKNWMDRLFFDRLERKSLPIESLLSESHNDWEAVFFCFLSKNFGLNTNGESFFKIAQSIPFSALRNEAFEIENIEALFFGRANLLDSHKEDGYYKELQSRWKYLQHKYLLDLADIEPLQFFQHRPDNFPTVRLSQLANLYHLHQNLFSKIIRTRSINGLYDIFSVSVSSYWRTHYQFDKQSLEKIKSLSKSFVDLLIINTIVPFQFAYDKSRGKESADDIIFLLEQVSAEKNTITAMFGNIGIHAENAFESQALLQLKKEYCTKSKCLQCSIGLELLKNN
ncbi:DUF2851 family protein [Flavobacterium sp.]|uniref:DUF2851 family protein n=1 Tax=Flavobacterium sp. TaxID=239 RepID=UPI003D6AEAF7